MIVTGKMSTFGGPADGGVAPAEGLALVEPADLASWWWAHLFLPAQPPGTTGLARRLNPDAYYLAMRWDYAATPRAILRRAVVRLAAGGRVIFAQPVDWGPHPLTGRIADLSPGAARALGLRTDDTVSAELLA